MLDSASTTSGGNVSFSATAASTGRVSGGGNLERPCSASAASVTPTAKKPIGRSATTTTREACTAQSGASAAGASSPSTAAHSGGLRRKNAATRWRGRFPTVPSAAPTENPTVTNATLDTSVS